MNFINSIRERLPTYLSYNWIKGLSVGIEYVAPAGPEYGEGDGDEVYIDDTDIGIIVVDLLIVRILFAV